MILRKSVSRLFLTNWLIKLCTSLPRELDRLNRGFPAPSHPDEETDRGGTRKKSFAMSEKVRIFAHGNARNEVPIWFRILRSFFDVSPIFPPSIFYITDNQRMFNTLPGYKKVVW